MEYYHPSEVHPYASTESMDAVLQQAPVSGLAVACVETVLSCQGTDVCQHKCFLRMGHKSAFMGVSSMKAIVI